jgi:hypothetical protein
MGGVFVSMMAGRMENWDWSLLLSSVVPARGLSILRARSMLPLLFLGPSFRSAMFSTCVQDDRLMESSADSIKINNVKIIAD